MNKLIFFALTIIALLGLCGCFTSPAALEREQAIYHQATNAVAIMQPIGHQLPAPIGTASDIVFLLATALLGGWNTWQAKQIKMLKTSVKTAQTLTPLLLFLFGLSSAGLKADEPKVFFSPAGGCRAAIIQEIDKATNSIYVQAYSFTARPIADALVKAKTRGCVVEVLFDPLQLKTKAIFNHLKTNGVVTLIDGKHAAAHNKVFIIDRCLTITGSYNLSENAERNNAENLLMLKDCDLATRYRGNFNLHKHHSKP